jgi:transcription elongation GreA/GreB family factor
MIVLREQEGNAMTGDPVRLTSEGKTRLERELKELRAKRPELMTRLQEAGAGGFGDTAELAEHSDAQWELSRVNARIATLEQLLTEAETIESPSAPGVVAFGSSVLVRNEEATERYTLVEPAEADPRRGFVSLESPVGRALLGHRPHETVQVETPAGPRRLEILAVD